MNRLTFAGWLTKLDADRDSIEPFVRTPLQTANAGCGSMHTRHNIHIITIQSEACGWSELGFREALGENVRLLLSGADVLGHNTILLADMGMEEMVLQS